MTIDLLFPRLPPSLDGIGDHTALLAQSLTEQGATVRILTAQKETTPIDGVNICTAFSLQPPWNVQQVVQAVQAAPPDWLFVQFNQFSYGRWGFNPWLPRALRRIKRTCPNTRIAWMAHEDFVPYSSWKFAIMRQWQRWQFQQLGDVADHIFFSIQWWIDKYQSWFPNTPVSQLPIGSNIPRTPTTKQAARRQVGLPDDALVLGIFGTVSSTRMLGSIASAARAACEAYPNVQLLYVGPDGHAIRPVLAGLPLHDAGPLSAADVSVHLQAMDIHLVPFNDGVSSRRGSFMAGLDHGVASVTTTGIATDPVLQAAANEAFLAAPPTEEDHYVDNVLRLCDDASLRERVGTAGRHLYQKNFDWPVGSAHLLETLNASPHSPTPTVASTAPAPSTV